MGREGIIRFSVTAMLLLFFSSFIGMYSWLQLQKYRARKEAKAVIIKATAPEHIKTMVFPKNQEPEGLRWLRDDEFELVGTLYDVLTSEERGDSVYLSVWEDAKETALNQNIRALTNRYVQAASGVPDDEVRWVQFLKQLMPAPDVWRMQLLSVGQRMQILKKTYITGRGSGAPPSPPPEATG